MIYREDADTEAVCVGGGVRSQASAGETPAKSFKVISLQEKTSSRALFAGPENWGEMCNGGGAGTMGMRG